EIVAKKKSFAQVASALDADEVVRARAGDLGWKSADTPDLPTPELADAVKKLTAGGEPAPGDPAPRGVWRLSVVGSRPRDLAVDMATDVWSNEAAKRAALDALAAAKASGKPLSDLYEKPPEPAPAQHGPDMQQLIHELQDPGTSPERKQELQQILQMLLQ